MSRTKSLFTNALPWLFTFALIMIAIPLWAGSPKTTASTPPVITVEAATAVKIVVGGKTVGFFDSHGLHVQGDVVSTGSYYSHLSHVPIYSGSVPDLTSSPARKP